MPCLHCIIPNPCKADINLHLLSILRPLMRSLFHSGANYITHRKEEQLVSTDASSKAKPQAKRWDSKFGLNFASGIRLRVTAKVQGLGKGTMVIEENSDASPLRQQELLMRQLWLWAPLRPPLCRGMQNAILKDGRLNKNQDLLIALFWMCFPRDTCWSS